MTTIPKNILAGTELTGIYEGMVPDMEGKETTIHRMLIPQRSGCGEHYENFHASKKLAEKLTKEMIGSTITIRKQKNSHFKVEVLEEKE